MPFLPINKILKARCRLFFCWRKTFFKWLMIHENKFIYPNVQKEINNFSNKTSQNAMATGTVTRLFTYIHTHVFYFICQRNLTNFYIVKYFHIRIKNSVSFFNVLLTLDCRTFSEISGFSDAFRIAVIGWPCCLYLLYILWVKRNWPVECNSILKYVFCWFFQGYMLKLLQLYDIFME